MNIDKITFWNPANAFGTAATVDSTQDDIPVKVNFYWSGAVLATTPQTPAQLEEAVTSFARQYSPPSIDKPTIFHFQWKTDGFYEIQDPGWQPTQ